MNSRKVLDESLSNLEESMGARRADPTPQLSPIPRSRDVGRRPLRTFGEIDVNLVIPDPDQPRMTFDEDSINKLSQNIRMKGQLNPVRVRWCQKHEKWIIVAGERRWRAVKQAGLPQISCYFHEQKLTPSEILEESLIENLHREDLNPIEEAKGYAELARMNGWNNKQVAESVGVHPATVSRARALLKLPNDVQEKVQNGTIAARSAYEMSRVKNTDQQRFLAHATGSQKLTHEQTARLARQRIGTKKRSRGTKLTFVAVAGWRVTVSHRKSGSYQEIEASLTEVLDEVRHRIKNRVRI